MRELLPDISATLYRNCQYKDEVSRFIQFLDRALDINQKINVSGQIDKYYLNNNRLNYRNLFIISGDLANLFKRKFFGNIQIISSAIIKLLRENNPVIIKCLSITQDTKRIVSLLKIKNRKRVKTFSVQLEGPNIVNIPDTRITPMNFRNITFYVKCNENFEYSSDRQEEIIRIRSKNMFLIVNVVNPVEYLLIYRKLGDNIQIYQKVKIVISKQQN